MMTKITAVIGKNHLFFYLRIKYVLMHKGWIFWDIWVIVFKYLNCDWQNETTSLIVKWHLQLLTKKTIGFVILFF